MLAERLEQVCRSGDRVENTHEEDCYYKGQKAILLELADLPTDMANEVALDQDAFEKHVEEIARIR